MASHLPSSRCLGAPGDTGNLEERNDQSNILLNYTENVNPKILNSQLSGKQYRILKQWRKIRAGDLFKILMLVLYCSLQGITRISPTMGQAYVTPTAKSPFGEPHVGAIPRFQITWRCAEIENSRRKRGRYLGDMTESMACSALSHPVMNKF
jgi:hypothetical protein